MAKVHPPIFDGIVFALAQIFEDGFHADKVIERAFKANRKWGGRDRKVFAEAVYEVVRWKRTLSAVAERLNAPSDSQTLLEIWFAAFQDEHQWPTEFDSEKQKILEIRAALSLADKTSFSDWFVDELEA